MQFLQLPFFPTHIATHTHTQSQTPQMSGKRQSTTRQAKQLHPLTTETILSHLHPLPQLVPLHLPHLPSLVPHAPPDTAAVKSEDMLHCQISNRTV